MALFIDHGDGRTGSAQGVSGVVNTYASQTSSPASRTITSSLTVSIGDLVLLHQSTGTGYGNAEMVRVATAPGGGAFTSTVAPTNTYTTGAQAIRIPQYTTGTTGTITATPYDGSIGGIAWVVANGSLNVTFSVPGSTGSDSGTGNALAVGPTSGGGFRGGIGRNGTGGLIANNGEGTTTSSQSTAANGPSGGGGNLNSTAGSASGGSGGHAVAGTAGTATGGAIAGDAGAAVGNANLTTLFFGGSGGGSSIIQSNSTASGGSGGGITGAFAPNLTVSGNNTNGGNGGPSPAGRGASAGAGGSQLYGGETVVLGSNVATSSGGTKGIGGGGDGVDGAVGRIAVLAPLSTSVTGTTTPSYTFVADNTLSQRAQGFII